MKIFRRYTRTKQIADKIEFNSLRAVARYKIKESKRNGCKKYVSTLNKDSPMKSIWKKVKKIDGKYSNPQQAVLEDNNIIITDQKKSLIN